MNRICPDDATPLERRDLRGLTLDVCPECAGLYFDEGELAALQQDGISALEAVESEATPSGLVVVGSDAPKRCPGCAGVMHGYMYRYSSDVRLDGCARCGGLWIQDGELSKIANYMAAPPSHVGGLPDARARAEAQNAEVARHQSLLSRIAARFSS